MPLAPRKAARNTSPRPASEWVSACSGWAATGGRLRFPAALRRLSGARARAQGLLRGGTCAGFGVRRIGREGGRCPQGELQSVSSRRSGPGHPAARNVAVLQAEALERGKQFQKAADLSSRVPEDASAYEGSLLGAARCCFLHAICPLGGGERTSPMPAEAAKCEPGERPREAAGPGCEPAFAPQGGPAARQRATSSSRPCTHALALSHEANAEEAAALPRRAGSPHKHWHSSGTVRKRSAAFWNCFPRRAARPGGRRRSGPPDGPATSPGGHG